MTRPALGPSFLQLSLASGYLTDAKPFVHCPPPDVCPVETPKR